MRQGSVRHALSERGNDVYETPPEATRALIKTGIIPHGIKIWEPCAGRGAISRELKDAGFNVLSSDIEIYDGADPDISRLDFFEKIGRCDGWIVTNPPFKDADRFIRVALERVTTVIVLLRLMAIEGARRSDIMDRHCTDIFAGIERLPMMHREGWAGPKLSHGAMPYGWFCFSSEAKPPTTPIRLHRISWRAVWR